MTDKELCYDLGIHRSTLYEWRRKGAPSDPAEMALWAQEEEAAKRLHIPAHFFHGFPRPVREKLLAAATDLKATESDHFRQRRPRRRRRSGESSPAC